MIAFFCFVLFAMLAFRSLALVAVDRSPSFNRLAHLLLALFFGAVAVVLFSFTYDQFVTNIVVAVILVLVVLIPTVISVQLTRKRPQMQSGVLLLLKTLLVLCALCISLLILMTAGFQTLTEDRPILKIVMTGRQRTEQVRWQPPNRKAENQVLPEYEVQFETPDGTDLERTFFYGDQVAVKVKVLRFRPILNLLGIRNLASIDFIYNGYTTAERHNFYPHHAEKILMGPTVLLPFQRRFWGFWEDVYEEKSAFWLIRTATLESNFFPLVNKDGSAFRGKYLLTVNSGGLSAVAVP